MPSQKKRKKKIFPQKHNHIYSHSEQKKKRISTYESGNQSKINVYCLQCSTPDLKFVTQIWSTLLYTIIDSVASCRTRHTPSTRIEYPLVLLHM